MPHVFGSEISDVVKKFLVTVELVGFARYGLNGYAFGDVSGGVGELSGNVHAVDGWFACKGVGET